MSEAEKLYETLKKVQEPKGWFKSLKVTTLTGIKKG